MSREDLLRALGDLMAAADARREQPDQQRLLHDLQVHQIELEMQNRELREARGALEASRNRYADLYDFAPVAYCTLSEQGLVEELNLTAATLFGCSRQYARGQPFVALVQLEDNWRFWQHLSECASSGKPVISEFRLSVQQRTVDVEAVSVPVMGNDKEPRSFRTALSDVTRRNLAEVESRRAHASEQQLRVRLQGLDQAHMEVTSILASYDRGAAARVTAAIATRARQMLQADWAALELSSGEQSFEDEGAPAVIGSAGAPPERAGAELDLTLCYGARRLGSLSIRRRLGEPAFTDHDRETLQMLAERVSSGLEIARLNAIEAREKLRLSLLDQIGRELTFAHDLEDMKRALARIADAVLPDFADVALVFVAEAGKLRLVHVGHADARRAITLRAALSDEARSAHTLDWLSAQLIEKSCRLWQREPSAAASAGVQPDASALARTLETSSLLLMPLCAREQGLGVLCFGRGEQRPGYAPSVLSWAQEIGSRCALALDNARLLEELRAALSWRENLLAMVSHDLKSPLSAISLSAVSLVPEAPVPERRSSGRQVDLIRRSADHMTNIINDLLLEGLTVAGNFELDLQLERVDVLVEEALSLCEPLAEARGLCMKSRLEADLPALRVDKERLLRVFSNLIGNAAKFSPPAGTIGILARRSDQSVIFSISDSGPGIAEEQRRHLFERYWRGAKGPRGLGLGLYIAKLVVEAHHGEIWVDSKLGEGAVFSFSLPTAC